MQTPSRFMALGVGLFLVVAVAGCGSAKVSNEKRGDLAPGAPSMVYVTNFDLGAAKVKSDPGTLSGRPRLLQLGHADAVSELQKLGDELEQAIVDDLRQQHFRAERLPDNAKRPKSGWLVGGNFLEVADGNRMQRAVVGFGAGASDAKLYVTVADAAKPQGKDLLDFNLTSDGNKTPGAGAGAVAMHTPYGMAAAFVLGGDAAEADLKRAAKEISDRIVKLAQQQAP